MQIVIAQDSVAELEQGFKNPPASAWPRTWWHWTNSNVTKEGITKDLEWMKRVGIAGIQLADVSAGGGQTVTNKIVFADVLKLGKNQLIIKVTNEWTNRLISDRLMPNKKVLDAYTAPFGGMYQLTESGLVGPVKLFQVMSNE